MATQGKMNISNWTRPKLAGMLSASMLIGLSAYAADDKKAKDQQEIRNLAHDTLQRLYKAGQGRSGVVDDPVEVSS